MPSSLTLTKDVVSQTFDLFDAEGAGTLDLDDFALAINALGIDLPPSDVESAFKKAKGANDNMLPISKDEFSLIVHDWNQKQTFHSEVQRMFGLFSKDAVTVDSSNFTEVHEEIGWEAQDERISRFISEASSTYHGREVDADVWMKVMCDISNEAAPGDDVEEY
eukprot:TRINITY_DN38403_c0_g1_i1.p2 TRINITY_DN38403_c0_g1~~TRINITY_DN38403_c0_g1_i1.p2  ORF type:complete len:164 (+),score=77.23 TRINITY_DN38403_c0_g1_i1:211-702(+)